MASENGKDPQDACTVEGAPKTQVGGSLVLNSTTTEKEIDIKQYEGRPFTEIFEDKSLSVELKCKIAITRFNVAYTDSDRTITTLTEAVVPLRKIVSIPGVPPLAIIIASEVIPVLLGLIRIHREDESAGNLIYEVAWTITNVASGTSTDTQYVVQLGGVLEMVLLLDHPRLDVRDQAVWCLVSFLKMA